MTPPALAQPFLLGTSAAGVVSSADQLELALQGRFKVQDLEPIGPPLQARPVFQLQMASAVIGELGVVSVQGSAMSLAVEPCLPLCMLALPSSGWGQYQMDDLSIENRMGQSVAFIPGRGWRLVNDITAGTSVQFREEALISRMSAIASGLSSVEASALLASPFAVSMESAEARFHYRQLLASLAMVDNSYRYGSGPPDPMLRLDDLVLRCVAMLLHPVLLALDRHAADQVSKRDLRRTIHGLMDWMQANLHRPISLSEMESRASYGRRALQQGFKAEVGCGPMQWLRKQRLLQAHQRLCDPGPETTVGQVAHACGYLNLAGFSRDFRERFGLSASELLRQSRPPGAAHN